MHMPKLDGRGAARAIRGLGYQGPILALSASSAAEDQRSALEAGCNAYLVKPVDVEELLFTLASFRSRTSAGSCSRSLSWRSPTRPSGRARRFAAARVSYRAKRKTAPSCDTAYSSPLRPSPKDDRPGSFTDSRRIAPPSTS